MGNYISRKKEVNNIVVTEDYTLDEHQPLNNFCVALYEHEPKSERELDIEKDDLMYLINEDDTEWCRVKKHPSGVIGWVPKTHITRLKLLRDEK